MQVEASDALDLNQETEATKKMYGIGAKPPTATPAVASLPADWSSAACVSCSSLSISRFGTTTLKSRRGCAVAVTKLINRLPRS